ncbi:MAG: glycosyltransferase family protein [bacterium]
MKPILGRPMLQCQIERLRRASTIDRLIVATSKNVSDDPIESLCGLLDIDCFRGDLEDVLDRFYQAARAYAPDYVVRLTGDCPLADPTLIDQVVSFCREGDYDYVSNTLVPTFPDGLDIEVCRYDVLTQAWREAVKVSEREHVTPFVWQQPDRYKLANFASEHDNSALRWTVDEPADLKLIAAIYEELYPKNPEFTTNDILELIDKKPQMRLVNSGFARNEGFAKSVRQDAGDVING